MYLPVPPLWLAEVAASSLHPEAAVLCASDEGEAAGGQRALTAGVGAGVKVQAGGGCDGWGLVDLSAPCEGGNQSDFKSEPHFNGSKIVGFF